jgi:hypothetical protein
MRCKAQGGFTFLELIVTLALAIFFSIEFARKPNAVADSDDIKLINSLSKRVFLSRLKSMGCRGDVVLSINNSKKKFTIEYFDDALARINEISYPFDVDDVKNCAFKTVKIPITFENGLPEVSTEWFADFNDGSVVFKKGFFAPFQMQFLRDGKTKSILVNEFAEFKIYEKK